MTHNYDVYSAKSVQNLEGWDCLKCGAGYESKLVCSLFLQWHDYPATLATVTWLEKAHKVQKSPHLEGNRQPG